MKQSRTIRTDEQRARTVAWRDRFEAAARELERNPPDDMHPDFVRMMIESHLVVAHEMDDELERYDREGPA